MGAYVALKAYQRWRLSRFVHAARISIDDLRAMLEQDPRPFVVDIGSKLAHQSRPHIPGAKLLDLDSVSRLADWPTDRDIVDLLRMSERRIREARSADPVVERVQARAAADRRHRRMDRRGPSGRAWRCHDLRQGAASRALAHRRIAVSAGAGARRLAHAALSALRGRAARIDRRANARGKRDRRIAAHEPAQSRRLADGVEAQRVEQVRHRMHVP